jgi:hypothetical protein
MTNPTSAAEPYNRMPRAYLAARRDAGARFAVHLCTSTSDVRSDANTDHLNHGVLQQQGCAAGALATEP